MFERIVIFGLGSLGSVIAAKLKDKGYEVVGKTRNDTGKEKNIRIIGEEEIETKISLFQNPKKIRSNDLVVLSVQPYQTLKAVSEIRKNTKTRGLINIINGVKTHAYTVQLLQNTTIMGGGAWWSATLLNNNTVFWSKKGKQVLGMLSGSREITKEMMQIISEAIPVQETSNPWEDLYQKLVLNLVNAVFTLTGQYYPLGLVSPSVRKLTIESIREGVNILKEMGFEPNPTIRNFLNLLSLPQEKIVEKMRSLPEIQRGDPHVVSSFRSYRAHAYSGAAWLSNEIIELGEQLQISTTYTKAIVEVLTSQEKLKALPIPPGLALSLVEEKIKH